MLETIEDLLEGQLHAGQYSAMRARYAIRGEGASGEWEHRGTGGEE